MKPKVHVEIRIANVSDNGLHNVCAILEDTMLKEQFTEFFHDYCRTFFCKSTMLKMPPEPSMEYQYTCHYSYEWLPSKMFGTTLIVKSAVTTDYIVMHVKDLPPDEEHIL